MIAAAAAVVANVAAADLAGAGAAADTDTIEHVGEWGGGM